FSTPTAVVLLDHTTPAMPGGDGTLSAPLPHDVFPAELGRALVDVDGDVQPDQIAASNASDGLAVAAGRPGGLFADAVDIPFHNFYNPFAVTDLDGDGRPDLLAVTLDRITSVVGIAVRLNNGTALGTGGLPLTSTFDPTFNQSLVATDELG